MSSDQIIGWGIVGCGRVADRRVAPIFAALNGANLVAVWARDPVKARDFAARHGVPRAYDNLDSLLQDDGVQAAYVATPNVSHAEMVIRCLHAGKHVLVDKPMAMDLAQAATMIEAARGSRRLLGVLHQQRFHPANQRLLKLVQDGALGRLNIVRMQIGFWYPPNGNWRLDPALSGGGAAMDLAPHAFDLAMCLAGPVDSIAARLFHLQFQYPAEDYAIATTRFASGAVGLFDFGYCTHAYGGRIEVFGSQGTFVADGSMQMAPGYRTEIRIGQAQPEVAVWPGVDCFAPAFQDFVNAIRQERQPVVTMDHGLGVMNLVDALYESARTQRTIDEVSRRMQG